MEKQQLLQFFQNIKLIRPDKAGEIASFFNSRELDKNEFFLKEGKVSDEYLFLASGFMRAFAHDTEGNDITTNFYTGNNVVFEVSSFFNRTPSRENIQAITPCSGWSITYDELNNLFHSMPEFREFGRHVLVTGFSALKSRMLSMITETAEERYQKLVHSNPHIFMSSPLKHIATYLGITDTSLSRIRKKFSETG